MRERHEQATLEAETAHEAQRTEMNELFEKQRSAMVNDYEAKLKELEERM